MSDRAIFGIPELDRVLAPALPAGWLGILEGPAGSGSPLLAKQFAHSALPEVPVYYYTTYERTPDVLRTFGEHGWGTDGLSVVNLADEYFDRVLRRDLEVSKTRERGLTVSDLLGPQPPPVRRRVYNVESRILADLAAIDRPFRFALDSLDFLLEVLSPADVMIVARQIRHLCQVVGGQALLVVQTDVHERRIQGFLEDMADLILVLRSELGARGPEHELAIRKVRNHPDLTQVRRARATASGLDIEAEPSSAP